MKSTGHRDISGPSTALAGVGRAQVGPILLALGVVAVASAWTLSSREHVERRIFRSPTCSVFATSSAFRWSSVLRTGPALDACRLERRDPPRAEVLAAALPYAAVLFLPIGWRCCGQFRAVRVERPRGTGPECRAREEGRLSERVLLRGSQRGLFRRVGGLAWYFPAVDPPGRDRRSASDVADAELERARLGALRLHLLCGLRLAHVARPAVASTIFGVYFFAGCVVGVFALLVVLVSLAQQRGAFRRAVTVEHYHDLGKQLFSYVFFWGYIAFSQYLLIWYANLPEEPVGW